MGLKHEIARLERTPGLLGTVNNLARLMSLTPRRVQQLAKAGIIAQAGRGGYDIVRCLAMYVAYLEEWRAAAKIPCSSEDLAHFLGLTKRQILYLTRIKIIPVIVPGRYDLATGVQAYLSFIKKNYKEEKKRQGRRAPWQPPLFETS